MSRADPISEMRALLETQFRDEVCRSKAPAVVAGLRIERNDSSPSVRILGAIATCFNRYDSYRIDIDARCETSIRRIVNLKSIQQHLGLPLPASRDVEPAI